MADPVIPQRTAIRGRVPGTYDSERRPGSSGQRYFSDIEYVTNVDSPAAQTAANLAAQARRNEQAAGLQALNVSNLARQQRPATFLPPAETPAGIATVEPNQTTGVQRIYDLLAQYIQGTQVQPYGYAEGGDVQGDPRVIYDENSNPAVAGREYNMLTTKYGMGPTNPASEEGLRKIQAMDKRRRKESTRTPSEYLADFISEVMAGPPDNIRATGVMRNAVEKAMLEGRISAEEGAKILSEMRRGPKSSGERFRFNQENPEFLRQLEAMKESRDRILKLKEQNKGYAQGGLASVAPQGMYLGGSTDGMADQIPATIDNRQPAALSDGEFVIPADVVSHLGNGNSDSGAKQLYGMMDRIRKARTGTTQQGKQINPNKFLA